MEAYTDYLDILKPDKSRHLYSEEFFQEMAKVVEESGVEVIIPPAPGWWQQGRG